MNYKFPLIRNIQDVLPAIEGADEFRVIEKEGGYKVINFMVNMEGTFPDVQSEHDAIRRECRGIMFDAKTGDIIRRPFHKFFNLNQRPETQIGVVDFSRPHTVVDKLDGSMIAPFFLDNGMMYFGTKLGVTEAAEKANAWAHFQVLKNYMEFSRVLIRRNYTPIFEWTSPNQRIVLRYPEDMLTLTAIRHMHTGEYVSFTTMRFLATGYNVPFLEPLMTVENIDEFVSMTAALKDKEGFVVCFNDGHKLKVKAEEYCSIHSAKDHIVREKNVLRLIFEEKLDDVLPLLTPEDRAHCEKFQDEVLKNVMGFVAHLKGAVQLMKQTCPTKKDFALVILDAKCTLRKASGLLFKIWDGHDPFTVVRNYLLTHCTSSNRVEEIRHIIGTTWVYGAIDIEGELSE